MFPKNCLYKLTNKAKRSWGVDLAYRFSRSRSDWRSVECFKQTGLIYKVFTSLRGSVTSICSVKHPVPGVFPQLAAKISSSLWERLSLDVHVSVWICVGLRSGIDVRWGGLGFSRCSSLSKRCLVELRSGLEFFHSNFNTSCLNSVCTLEHCHTETGLGLLSPVEWKQYEDMLYNCCF